MKTPVLALPLAPFLALLLATHSSAWQREENRRPKSNASPAPVRLRCEYLVEPQAIDVERPRFSWEFTDTRRGARQTAYRLLVTRGAAHAVVWDSGKVLSSGTCQVTYGGPPLHSAHTYQWALRTWSTDTRDGNAKPSAWSKRSSFGIGLLDPQDWQARWIGDATPPPPVIPGHNGYHSELSDNATSEKWVVIDLGDRRTFDGLRLWPARPHDWREDVPGFLFPVRFAVEISDEADFATQETVIDHTGADQPDPRDQPVTLRFTPCTARFVRLRVTRLEAREPEAFGLALAEMDLLEGEEVISTGAAVAALDSIEHNDWSTVRLTDGDRHSHPGSGLQPLPCPMLRKEFSVHGKIERAVAYVSALGVYELHVNGRRAGDHILAPEWTDYKTRVQYQAYDITSLLRPGRTNAIGVILGDGWYAGRIGFLGPDRRAFYGRRPALLMQLRIELSDGRTTIIKTDETWHSTLEGPILSSDILAGEDRDDRREMPGWDQAGFDASDWLPVEIRDPAPVALVAQPNEPIRVVEELSPRAIAEPAPGVFVVDFGQNMVGWVRLRAHGQECQTITLRHAEMLDPESGMIYTDNLRTAQQTDRYTLGSSGEAVLEPHFTYHGFRFVEITGLEKRPASGDVTGRVFCSSAARSGLFSCADPLIERLYANVLWTQRANFMGVPTDCPQRDERLGWMGDILAFSQTAIFNMDLAAFFTKWLADVRDAQLDDGRYSDFSPQPFPDWTSYGVPGWADAGTVVPWRCYVNYADRRLLSRHYDSARRWVEAVAGRNPDHLWRNERGNDYGDWLNGDTLIRKSWPRTGAELPKEVFATMMFAHSTDLVARMAHVLGKQDDEKRFTDLRGAIEAAFTQAYVDDEGKIRGETQAGYALALHLGLLDAPLRPRTMDHLLDAIDRYDIDSKGGRLSTGFHSTLPMMVELTRAGRADVAYRFLTSRLFPSWGYTIDNGASTIWERWDGYVKGRGFQDPGMNSFNHYALGSVGEWIYRTILGIAPDQAHPGYEHFIVHPIPGGGLEWARGSYRSIRGTIEVDWHVKAGDLVLALTIPPGTSATVTLPTRRPAEVMEGGRPAAASAGLVVLGLRKDAAVFEVPAGRYEFVAPAIE